MSILQSYSAFPVAGGGSLPATAQNGASMVLLSTITANNSATVSFESNINSTYDMYQIIAENITSSAGAALYAQLKIAGAYQTSGYYFRGINSAATYQTYVSQIDLTSNTTFGGGATDNSGSMIMYIPYPSSTTNQKSILTSTYPSGISAYPTFGTGLTQIGVGALTGVKLYFSSGTISTGTFRLYGIKNS